MPLIKEPSPPHLASIYLTRPKKMERIAEIMQKFPVCCLGDTFGLPPCVPEKTQFGLLTGGVADLRFFYEVCRQSVRTERFFSTHPHSHWGALCAGVRVPPPPVRVAPVLLLLLPVIVPPVPEPPLPLTPLPPVLPPLLDGVPPVVGLPLAPPLDPPEGL